jgi:hypothetical protein
MFEYIQRENNTSFFLWMGCTCLHHEYEMRELWIYYRWTHILGWSYACQIFWVRPATKFREWEKWFYKFQNSKRKLPLTKLNKNNSYYVDKYLSLIGLYMLLRNLSKFIQLRVFHNQGITELTLTMISHLPTT